MNELERRAKFHSKHQRGLSPFCSLGEDTEDNRMLNEVKNKETIDLEFEDLEIEVCYRRGRPGGYYDRSEEQWYPDDDDTKTVRVDWTMQVDKESVEEFLGDKALENDISKDEQDKHEADLDEFVTAYVKEHFDDLLEKYEDDLIEYYTEDATSEAEEEYYDTYYDCYESVNKSIKEAKHRSRKKRKPFDSIVKNAGNVEHNVNMFNKMNSPIDGPSNNPISGPFGGDATTSGDAGASGMGESLESRPRYVVDAFNWSHEEVTVTCYDTQNDKVFDKFLSYGANDEDTGRRNALALLKDPDYDVSTEVKNELISTFGLDDFGYKIEESKKSQVYEGLDDVFDMSMRTLI